MRSARLSYLIVFPLALALFGTLPHLFGEAEDRLVSTARRPSARQSERDVPGSAFRPLRTAVPVEPLLEIEQRVLPKPLRQGPPSHATLADYYWAENPQLIACLDRAKRAYDQLPDGGFRAMTLVTGTAGVGKTFLQRKILKQDFPESAVHKVDIRELYEQWADDGICVFRPDLSAGSCELGRLPALRDSGSSRFRQHLASQHASVFVIDSLDEIHPDDYLSTLRQIHAFVRATNRPFVQVFVFGRVVAFQDFRLEQRQEVTYPQVTLLRLHPPCIRTTGDLTVSSWNYHTWKYGLSWAPDGGESGKMPLAAYRDWVRGGFQRAGEFRSVTCAVNNDMSVEVDEALVDWATKHLVVSSTLDNLAGNTLMREIVEKEVLAGRPFDERRVMAAYLHHWLLRSTKSHGRPSARQPQQLDLYLYLLQQVAARYLHEGQVDSRGFFPVREDDRLVVLWQGKSLEFPVAKILDRSGLMSADFQEDGITRYRCRPVWIHRLLVEMHNEQCRKAG